MELAVCVVDDDKEVRQCLESLLRSIGLIVRSFSSAPELLASGDLNHVGCLLLDVRMPRMSGLMLQDELIARQVEVPIIFLSGHADPLMVAAAMKKGACDFFLKPFSSQCLLDTVQCALDRAHRLQERRARAAEVRARLALLTVREREILERVKIRQPPKVIAREMGLSRKTVDTHLGAIRQKMHAECTAEVLLTLQGHLPETSTPSAAASLRCIRCPVR